MKIGLLTCQRLSQLTPADQLLIPEFAKYDCNAEAVIWDDPLVDWQQFDYLIFRNTWDYYEKEIAFNTWLDSIKKKGIPTLNSIEVIQKNKHKFYLKDLQRQGIKIIPTVFIEKTADLQLSKLLPNHWKKAVIKPAFSAGSYLTEVFTPDEAATISEKYSTIASEKELLLQEFMPEIETEGETSFVFFNGIFSHAVNKKPAAGDFRIQSQFGGQYSLIDPNNTMIEKAQKVVTAFSKPLLYARVDGIIINSELYLMEIESIEPDLYFNLAPGALQKFVAAVLEIMH